MDSRFTIKDAFFTCLLIALIAIVAAAMWQFDRQNDRLATIDAKQQQTVDSIADFQRRLNTITASGGSLTAATQPASQPAVDPKDPFYRQREAMALPDYATGDRLVQNIGTKFSKITPLLSSDIYANYVKYRVMEYLAYRDPYTLDYTPGLATSWTIEDKSEAWNAALAKLTGAGKTEAQAVEDASMPTALEITFKLRPNVVYSDGKPFTADDVVFSFNFAMIEAVDAARVRSALKEVVRSVEKIDDLTVVFKFKRPYFEAFGLAAESDILPKHFFEKFTSEPQKFNDSVGLMLGTGPYRLEDPTAWTPGKPMVLVRNERYWGPPGPFDRLVFREIESDAAALIDFKNGDQDTFGANPEQYVELKDEPKINSRAKRFEYYALDGGYTYISWNQKRAGKATRFADKRVRQAMTMLIDREAMATDIYRGYAKAVSGPFSPSNKQNAPDVQPWPFDPVRARAQLKDAGYEDRDGDGVLDGPDGKPFRFEFRYNAKNPVSKQIAFFVKDSLARGGIAVDTEATDWPIMIEKLRNQDFDAITLGWSGGPETDIYQMFHSSQAEVGADNSQSYINLELDKLMVAARSTIDPEKRMPLWQACHRIIHEDQPYTFLLVRQNLQFVDNRIANVKPATTGLNFMNTNVGPIPWYVPTGAQKRSN